MQYYIAQTPSTQPTQSQNKTIDILTSSPVVWTVLITSLLSVIIGTLLGHILTKRRDKGKSLNDDYKEAFHMKTQADSALEMIKFISEDIKKNSATRKSQIEANKNIKANGLAIQNLDKKVSDGFEAINIRLDNLLK